MPFLGDAKLGKPITERKLIELPSLKESLRDFAFLLECSEPGTLPEPQLVASFLDLVSYLLLISIVDGMLHQAHYLTPINSVRDRGLWGKKNVSPSVRRGLLFSVSRGKKLYMFW